MDPGPTNEIKSRFGGIAFDTPSPKNRCEQQVEKWHARYFHERFFFSLVMVEMEQIVL